MRSLVLLSVALLAAARPAPGQAPTADERLQPVLRAGLSGVLEGAAGDGLPARPLVLKALEGVTKGAPPPRVVEVVRDLAARMRSVHAAFGGDVPEEVLVSGAAALATGARTEDLRRVARGVAPTDRGAALGALAYLLERGLPLDDSVALLATLSATGASGADLVSLQRLTEQEVRGGASPGEAAWRQVRAITGTRRGARP